MLKRLPYTSSRHSRRQTLWRGRLPGDLLVTNHFFILLTQALSYPIHVFEVYYSSAISGSRSPQNENRPGAEGPILHSLNGKLFRGQIRPFLSSPIEGAAAV